MKRSPALRSLSRDHHQALAMSQRLRRAGETSEPEDVAAEFLGFWREHGGAHFVIEEQVLLPRWAQLTGADPGHVGRVANEHLEIRAAALEVEEGGPGLRKHLLRLGHLLRAHVRYEERELFPLIERQLGERGLEELAAAVASCAVTPDPGHSAMTGS